MNYAKCYAEYLASVDAQEVIVSLAFDKIAIKKLGV
jgi:hypothetical protein